MTEFLVVFFTFFCLVRIFQFVMITNALKANRRLGWMGSTVVRMYRTLSSGFSPIIYNVIWFGFFAYLLFHALDAYAFLSALFYVVYLVLGYRLQRLIRTYEFTTVNKEGNPDDHGKYLMRVATSAQRAGEIHEPVFPSQR